MQTCKRANRTSKKAIAFLMITIISLLSFIIYPAHQAASALSIKSLSQTSGSINGDNSITIKGQDFITNSNETITQLTAGGFHSLALTASGRVFAWGYNHDGQLGTSDNNGYNTPQDITKNFKGEKVTQLAAGYYHSLALTASGKVFAWGDNDHGQLGTGNNTSYSAPQDITSQLKGETVTQLAAGYGHSLALTASSKVFTWGDNEYGQLGTDNNTSYSAPQDITKNFKGEKVTQLAAGYGRSLALTASGKVLTWGYNDDGQLGTSDNNGYNTPQDITKNFKGETVTQLAAGVYHSLALTKSNKVLAWGYNEYGQLGTGNNTSYNTPQDITNQLKGETVTQLAASHYHSLALTASGKVFAWGDNDDGQLGTGDTTDYNTPQDITANFNLELIPTNQISTIYFGDTKVTDFKTVDANTIELTVPAHAAGKVDVRLESIDGSSTMLADGYEYTDSASTKVIETTPATGIVAPNTGVK